MEKVLAPPAGSVGTQPFASLRDQLIPEEQQHEEGARNEPGRIGAARDTLETSVHRT